jgi:hypothetical protein
MAEPTRTAAQQRADEIRMFGEELARLEREGVVALTPAQREAIGAKRCCAIWPCSPAAM